MNNYLIIIIGWIIGQAVYATKKAWDLQKKYDHLSFTYAIATVYSKETASFIFGILMLIVLCFTLPDFFKEGDIKDMEEVGKLKYYLVTYIRIASVAFGFVCQYLGMWLFGKAEKAIIDKAKTDGIEIK